VTHDIRYFEPFPVYVERAQGARKWDVDGNEIIDFVMGHGALLFGHAHPLLVKAVSEQIQRGTHYGASHKLEVEWARAIQALLPTAEKVRFTSSGTEATMLAVRLARAATGRSRLLKLRLHFHGWNDSVMTGARTSSGAVSAAGLPPAMTNATTVIDQHDTAAMGAALDGAEYAAVICEPSGYGWGTGPLDPSVLEFLRERTAATGTLLIFDEVVTGFRLTEGGVQGLTGLRPDLTTLAKVLAGGMPGGAVVGRAELLDQIAFGHSDEKDRVAHPGTYNANPLSAAAGIAALREIETGEPIRIANERARRLSAGLNHAIRQAEVPGAAYGQASLVHIVLGQDVPPPQDDFTWSWGEAGPQATVPATADAIRWGLRRSLLTHGVDLMGMGAIVSCVHSETDIDRSVDAFSAALADLRRESIL
ncbi:MAG: aminotransferase class III-fold pyridoxal phosphate-dependent enzyme, partial [Dehalococcoidia bacterium]